MRSPHTIGDECPDPGTSVFHEMFLSGAHSVGSCFSDETPCPPGPRHCAQFSAKTRAPHRIAPAEMMVRPTRTRAARIMDELLLDRGASPRRTPHPPPPPGGAGPPPPAGAP